MSQKSNRIVRASLFISIIELLAFVAFAVASFAQTSVDERAGDSSRQVLFNIAEVDPNMLISASPAQLALADVAGAAAATAGGLWLSGDTAMGIRHLQWIAGNQPAGLLEVDNSGKVSFDLRVLAKTAGAASGNPADWRERIASFVRSDEGLLLLAEVISGRYRYLLHIGCVAPTFGDNVRFMSLINLDNRFDSRVNPRRRNGQKLACERPPEGFDSLIGINPDAVWFNLNSQQLVSASQMAFHELAEAHAKLVLELDYLPQGDRPGAHNVAVWREIKLKQERPEQSIVISIGSNRLLISHNDWAWMYAQLKKQKGAKSVQVNK